jgi:hypothetical protein
VTLRLCAPAIRPCLRFAERHQGCRPGLADAIRSPRIYADEGTGLDAPQRPILKQLREEAAERLQLVRPDRDRDGGR